MITIFHSAIRFILRIKPPNCRIHVCELKKPIEDQKSKTIFSRSDSGQWPDSGFQVNIFIRPYPQPWLNRICIYSIVTLCAIWNHLNNLKAHSKVWDNFGQLKALKNVEKCFLFHFKSSFRSQDVCIFVLIFGHLGKRLD